MLRKGLTAACAQSTCVFTCAGRTCHHQGRAGGQKRPHGLAAALQAHSTSWQTALVMFPAHSSASDPRLPAKWQSRI